MSRRSNRGKTHHRRVSAQQKKDIIRRLGLPIGEQRNLAYKESILKGAIVLPLQMIAEWKDRLRDSMRGFALPLTQAEFEKNFIAGHLYALDTEDQQENASCEATAETANAVDMTFHVRYIAISAPKGAAHASPSSRCRRPRLRRGQRHGREKSL